MRRLAIFLSFLPALAFAVDPATLETRSPAHALIIDVIPVGNGAEYSARVTDLRSGELLATAKFVPADHVSDSVSELRDLRIRIHLQPTYNGLFASAQIEQRNAVIDAMDAHWTLQPRTAPISHEGLLRVGKDVKAPIVIHKVEPIYSEEARRARISGIVIVEAVIDKTGAVRDVSVLKPLPFGLDQAAVDAVKQWKFEPAKLEGKPVDVVFNMTVNFRIDVPKPAAPPQ
jgi:TonB family protein